MTDVTNFAVFAIVVLLRIGIPLAIPRFPLPSIVAALIIDAADQTIFQQFTTLNLDGYQSYDKALDIYYLAVAYIATMRNWSNLYAFRVSQFLWYYRLIGVAAFEFIGGRFFLLIFPNTFEYFFIWYEGVRTLWNPLRLTHRHVLGAAAFIWIFIKLPQEYWIHIAQLDTTDFIKEEILGVTPETSWITAIGDNLWVVPVVLVIAGVLIVAGRRGWRELPPEDWTLTLDADDHRDIEPTWTQPARPQLVDWHTVAEKIALVGIISAIFSQILPSTGGNSLSLIITVAVIIIGNAAISTLLSRRGRTWSTTLSAFVATAVVNFGLAILWLTIVSDDRGGENALRVIVFFVLLLSLIVTLYDRYRPIYERRVELAEHRLAAGESEAT